MSSKKAIIHYILQRCDRSPKKEHGTAFAPSNIALCKYWGKRNLELNLPINSSLSISLADRGAHANIRLIHASHHEIVLNGELLPKETPHAQRLASFLDLFRREENETYRVEFRINIPVASGLASSACIFASLTKALDDLYQWKLNSTSLSILARMGSGSACRSIYDGFVEWQHGERSDGLDSVAVPIEKKWPELCIGLCLIDTEKKTVGSREGMLRTVKTSSLYSSWPETAEHHLTKLKIAIREKDFTLLGQTAEANALAMHATMLAAWPPLLYSKPETIDIMRRIWELREQGMSLYFTQDAGPNIKLLFLACDLNQIKSLFPKIEIITPFKNEP